MNPHRRRQLILYSLMALGESWPSPHAFAASDADFMAVIASPLRSEDDRKADENRKPLALLRFAQLQAGMTVLDISAGGGYTTQLMALAVGPRGKVWSQLEQPRPALDQRLAEHPQANIEVLLRPLEDPFPAAAPRVDLVTLVLSYHDIAYAPVNRSRMNRAIFAALKPGGHLLLIDHAAKPGHGLSDVKTLHRIDKRTVRSEIESVGFVFEAEADFLRNPKDRRERAFFDMTTPTDRFVLRFVKPCRGGRPGPCSG